MSIKEDMQITIYNQNNFNLSVVTNIRNIYMSPCKDDVPTMDYISYNELVFVNSQSNAIRSGLIMFDEDKKAEIYEALQIPNWNSILSNKEIKDILINPTIAGLEKIISNREQSVFDRVRCILTGLLNSGEEDISVRVNQIIEARAAEFRRGELVTRIQLRKTDEKSVDSSKAEIDALKAQNEALMKQMQDMMAMMAQNQSNATTEEKTKKTRIKKTAAKEEVAE